MGLIIHEQRSGVSPYIESITQGRTEGAGSTVRPAECHWHMVIVRHEGHTRLIVAGSLTSAGVVSWAGGAEILWVKFPLGTFMPHLPAKALQDKETLLPDASNRAFYLKGSAWEVPHYENVDVFIARLVREEVILRDPVVEAVLAGQDVSLSPRTVRHRFLQSTGLTQTDIHQIRRAQQAAALLTQGVSILDTVHDAGYFDQPHLTRSLRRWVGHTPAQLIRQNAG